MDTNLTHDWAAPSSRSPMETGHAQRGGGAHSLWGIDCPEAKQAFGTRAKQLTGDLAFGNTVTVKVRAVDRYKRTVAHPADSRNLNQEIVEVGLAWWYRQ